MIDRSLCEGFSRRGFLGLVPLLFLQQPSSGLDVLKARITELIEESKAKDVAVAYHDLANGDELLIHADHTFHAASVMKVPVLMEVFRQAEEGAFTLDDKITITNQFHSIVDGSLYELKIEDDSEFTLYRRIGEEETIRELCRLMITESSNLATNLLIERVGAAKISAFMVRLGAKDIHVLRCVEDGLAYRQGRNNTLTAPGTLTILRRLAERKVVSKRADEAMLAILRGQKFNDGIPAGLPSGIPVAHKTGWISTAAHDAAIVEPPDATPFVLVVLTRGIAHKARAERLIAEITRAVYQHAADVRAELHHAD